MWKDCKEHERRMHLEHHSFGYCQVAWRSRVLCCCEGGREVVDAPVNDGRSWPGGDRGGSQRQQRLQRICNRRGLGKLRHMEVELLWLQHCVQSGKVALRWIACSGNLADLFTMYLTGSEIVTYSGRLRFCAVLGRSTQVDTDGWSAEWALGRGTIRIIHAGTLLNCAPEQLRYPSEWARQRANMGKHKNNVDA